MDAFTFNTSSSASSHSFILWVAQSGFNLFLAIILITLKHKNKKIIQNTKYIQIIFAAMQNVKITIEAPDGIGGMRVFSNILPQTAIENTQRIYGNAIKSIVPVDENGNETKTVITKQSREDIAMEAMKARAKALGIPGYQKMKSDTLLKAIQEYSNKSAAQTATNVLTETNG